MLAIALVVNEEDVYLYEAQVLDGVYLVEGVHTTISAAVALAGCRASYARTEQIKERQRQRFLRWQAKKRKGKQ